VAYVGSKTSHLDQSISFNNPQPKFQDTNVQARRPYPFHVSEGEGNVAFGTGNIRYLDSYANGSYHGLQNSLEKRFSKGLVFGVAYTYSKALGEGYERNNSLDAPQDPNDRRASRRRYPFDVTHNGVINFVYEMPFLQRYKSVAGAIIGGWQMNGIINLRTGFPFSLQGTGNLNTGGVVLPDRVADGRLGDKATRQLWFDPTAFRRTDCNIPNKPELCHYGNAGFGILNSPGAKNIDFSLYKNWRLGFLGERGSLQFRSEFFNLFNTPQFGQPNGIGFATLDSVVPDSTRMGEIRSLRLPMRVIQLGSKIYF
jgi:hypothetical protein